MTYLLHEEGASGIHSARVRALSLKSIFSCAPPFEYAALQWLLSSSARVTFLFWMYSVLSVCLIGFYIYEIYEAISDSIDHREIPLFIVYNIQNVMFLTLPFLLYKFLDDLIRGDYVQHILLEATRLNSSVDMRFRCITHTNFLFLSLAVIVYAIESEESWSYRAGAVFTSVIYLFPLCYFYSLCIYILDAHRVISQGFFDDLRSLWVSGDKGNAHGLNAKRASGSQDCSMLLHTTPISLEENSFLLGTLRVSDELQECSSVEEQSLESLLRKRYFRLHALCIKSSFTFGIYLFTLLFYTFVFSVAVIWSIFLRKQSFLAALAFVLICCLLILELGIGIASANELGHTICREISSYLLCNDSLYSRETAVNSDALLLVSNMQFAKIEIFFFGNFALRARHLLALFGSFLGAAIPALLLHI